MKAGNAGEMRVSRILAEINAEAIHDFVFVEKGVTRQVDHIVRGSESLIVLETKNWSGTIAGGPRGSWRVQGKKERKARYFDNPLEQNAGHLGGLVRMLGQPATGVVVMAGSGKPASGGFPEGVVTSRALAREMMSLGAGMRPSRGVEAAWRELRRQAAPSLMKPLRRRHEDRMRKRNGHQPWWDWWALGAGALAACVLIPGDFTIPSGAEVINSFALHFLP
jgi:hypothetical protein